MEESAIERLQAKSPEEAIIERISQDFNLAPFMVRAVALSLDRPRQLDLVIASLSMAGAATLYVRNFLALWCIIGVFGQPRPSAQWCECARLRVWFRLSVA